MTNSSIGLAPGHRLSNKPYLFSLAFLFLLAVHYYQPNGGGAGLALAFNNTVWIGVSLVIAVGLWRIAQSGQLFYGRLELLLLLTAFCLCLPLVWSESPWREQAYGRYLGLFALVILVVTHRQFQPGENEQQVLWLLPGGAALIQVFIGLAQFFNADEWAIIQEGRPVGSFQQVNTYASFLATGMAVSVLQILSGPLTLSLRFIHLLVVFMVGLMEALVLSRVGLVGTVLVLVGLGLLFRKPARLLMSVYLVFVLGLAAAYGLHQVGTSEGRSIDSVTTAGYRTTQYRLSWELIKEAPVAGHGLGTFQNVFMNKQAEAYASGEISDTHGSASSSHPHNELLYWWVETGILPVVVFLLLAYWVSFSVWRQADRKSRAFWLCLLPIVFHTQTELPFYHSAIHLVLFSLLLSQLQFGVVKSKGFPPAFLAKSIAVILVAVTTVYMTTNLNATHRMGQYYVKRQPEDLLGIVNPFAQYQTYEFLLSDMFIRSNKPDALSLAAEMQERAARLAPNETVYRMLMDISVRQGDTEKAVEWARRGHYLFPENPAFR